MDWGFACWSGRWWERLCKLGSVMSLRRDVLYPGMVLRASLAYGWCWKAAQPLSIRIQVSFLVEGGKVSWVPSCKAAIMCRGEAGACKQLVNTITTYVLKARHPLTPNLPTASKVYTRKTIFTKKLISNLYSLFQKETPLCCPSNQPDVAGRCNCFFFFY